MFHETCQDLNIERDNVASLCSNLTGLFLVVTTIFFPPISCYNSRFHCHPILLLTVFDEEFLLQTQPVTIYLKHPENLHYPQPFLLYLHYCSDLKHLRMLCLLQRLVQAYVLVHEFATYYLKTQRNMV